MDALFIEKQTDTPEINFNPAQNLFRIAGKSMPDNPLKFYSPIFDWLNQYKEEVADGAKIVFEVKFDYFNTASSKLFLDMLDIFAEFQETGAQVSIVWYYRAGDDDMKEAGEEYSELVEAPFEIKEY